MGVIRYLTKATANTVTLGGYSAGKAVSKAFARGVTTEPCPHCGTRSARRFGVCPACGRAKR